MIVTANPRSDSDGSIVRQFTNTVDSTGSTYTYDTAQDNLTIWNKGYVYLTLNVGTYSNVTIEPLITWENDVSFTSFTIQANGISEIQATAKEYDNKPIFKKDLADIANQTYITEKAKKTYVDKLIDAYWYNTTRVTLAKWKTALDKVVLGTGNAKVLCIGDSTMWGFGTNGPDGSAPPIQLASMLSRYIAPAQNTFIVPPGDQAPTSGTGSDERWTIPSGWNKGSWGFGGKGDLNHIGTGTSNPLLVNSGINCDTFDVYYLANQGVTGTITLSVDGGAPVVVDTGAISGFKWAKTTITCPSGSSHVLSIVKSLNTVFILGVDAYLSTTKSIHVMNAGLCSSRAYTDGTGGLIGWGSHTGSGRSDEGIKLIAPDLTIIQLGINDAQLTPFSSTTNWENSIRTLITASKVSGDVILASVIPSDTALYNGDTVNREQGYRARCLTIAQEMGIAYLDIFGRFNSYADAQPAGLMADQIHINTNGSADMADAYRRLLNSQ